MKQPLGKTYCYASPHENNPQSDTRGIPASSLASITTAEAPTTLAGGTTVTLDVNAAYRMTFSGDGSIHFMPRPSLIIRRRRSA